MLLQKLRYRLSPHHATLWLRRRLYARAFYMLTLRGRGVTEIHGSIPDPRPGTPDKAAPIIAAAPPWDGPDLWSLEAMGPGDPVMGVFGFRWLSDLRADDSERARERCVSSAKTMLCISNSDATVAKDFIWLISLH